MSRRTLAGRAGALLRAYTVPDARSASPLATLPEAAFSAARPVAPGPAPPRPVAAPARG